MAEVSLRPVKGDPFAAPQVELRPVAGDPFAPPPPPGRAEQRQAGPTANVSLKPVQGDPFAAPAPKPAASKLDVGKVAKDVTKPFFDTIDQAAKAVMDDFKPMKPRPGVGGFARDMADSVLKPLKTAGDIGNLVASPVTGALNIASTPLEKATRPKDIPGVRNPGGLDLTGAVMAGAPELGGTKGPGAFASGVVKDVKSVANAGKEAVEATKALFAPTTVSPAAEKTGRVIRGAAAKADLEADRAAHRLVEHNKVVGNLPVPEQRALIAHIEDPKNVPAPKDPRLQAAAKDIRGVYDTYEARVQQTMNSGSGAAGPSFVDDYYAHLWKDKPTVVQDAIGSGSRQGSGRNLKQRSIPTIADGLAAGLTPKFENPIETTMAYARNMSRYLATHDIKNEMEALGHAEWHPVGQAPPGMVQLDGALTKKPGKVIIDKATGQAIAGQPEKGLYAPPAVARVYNRFIGKGLESGDAGPFYKGARQFSNALTQAKLGLSAFHLSTMGNEGMVGETARAIQAASRGDLKTAGKALASAPIAPVKLALRGGRMKAEMLGSKAADPVSQKINAAYTKAGGRLGMDPFYRSRASGSFFQAMERGTFKRELGDAVKAATTGTPFERAKGSVDLAASAVQSLSAPLFEKYIPSVKRGAFATRMNDWLEANPGASAEETEKYATKLVDSIDNRFGELVQDNFFWSRTMKQMAQILLLSASWDIGTVREIAGGMGEMGQSAKGVLEGKGVTDKTAYVAALAAVTAAMNGVATYMKTGTAPHGMDFAAYRTGGVDASTGEPERAMVPGYAKDVYAFGHDFPRNILHEADAKLNPGLKAAVELSTNKDFRGLPAYRPEGAQPVDGEPTLADWAIEQFMPISLGASSKRKKGTNISVPEQTLGIRAAPRFLTAPEQEKQERESRGDRAWQRRLKADAKAQSMREGDE